MYNGQVGEESRLPAEGAEGVDKEDGGVPRACRPHTNPLGLGGQRDVLADPGHKAQRSGNHCRLVTVTTDIAQLTTPTWNRGQSLQYTKRPGVALWGDGTQQAFWAPPGNRAGGSHTRGLGGVGGSLGSHLAGAPTPAPSAQHVVLDPPLFGKGRCSDRSIPKGDSA